MKKRLLIPLFLALAILLSLTVISFATSEEPYGVDAMIEILADETLSGYKLETYELEDDGYLGIPVELTYYYDSATHGAPTRGVNGTTLIMYVVNTRTARSGTDSDVSIIQSMLARGYIVAVADYKYNVKAVPDDIEWSTQTVMSKLRSGAYFTNETIVGAYNESFVVPAGHDVSLNHVYWELDKHSVDGTLEKIVEVWNEDFRGYKAESFVKWDNNGVRKATQNGYDGTSPIWYSYDAETGTYTEDENGVYIKVKHTLAQTITDCVKKDGTPIDLNLYLNVVYPTNPEHTVPVMTLASSSEHLANGASNAVRPHTYGFAFEGYAVAMFDYAYIPMARVDHYGYFDGSSPDKGSITGDNMTYSLGTYNSAYVGTAALRYIRYLALSDPDTFAFNGTVGVIGNSKASAYTHLANLDLCETKALSDGYTEEELLDYAQAYLTSFGHQYYLYNHHGETRYEVGEVTYTENGFTVDGGELQPWMIYEGEMIPSGAQFVYSCCGAQLTGIDENYAPLFTSGHIDDEASAYGNNGLLANYAKVYDIPMVYFEVSLGHTFVARENKDFDTDPYAAYKDYAHYVLNNGPVSVVGTNPLPGAKISLSPSILIKFAGCVSESEIAKVTLTDENGKAILCTFEGAYGGTEWTVKPLLLSPDTEYTLTVPASILGKNGVAIREEYTATFVTQKGSAESLNVINGTTVTSENGTYLEITVPDMSAYSAQGVNRAELRFFVSNNASNRMGVYLVDDATDTEGELVDAVPLHGTGYYTVDLTSLLMAHTAGEKLTVLLKAERASGVFNHTTSTFAGEDFEDNNNTFSVNGINPWTWATVDEEHGTSMQVYLRNRTSSGVHKYYSSNVTLTKTGMILDSVTPDDLGRRFTVTFEIYDTVSRNIRVHLGNRGSSSTGVVDYDVTQANFVTKAGEWVTCSFEFVIQDPIYGVNGLKSKDFYLHLTPTGSTHSVVYFDNFAVSETVSDVTLAEASLVLSSTGATAYKAPTSLELPFKVGENTYATISEAIAALGETNTVTLLSSITLTDETVIRNIPTENLVLDLNGYEIRTVTGEYSPITLSDGSSNIVLKNGAIYLSHTSLVSYDDVSGTAEAYLTLENMFIGAEDGAMVSVLLANTEAPLDATVSLSLRLVNSTVDMSDEQFTKNPVRMISTSTDSVSFDATFEGGSIYLTRPHKVDIFDNTKDITFVNPDTNGTVFYLTAGREFTEGDMALADDTFRYFEEITSDVSGFRAYKLVKDNLCTPFGVIPEEYADEEKYPFVVFNRETDAFFIATDIFATDNAGGALWALYFKAHGQFGIYLRRDFVHNPGSALWNTGFVGSEVIIDLGGHTFTHANTAGSAMLIAQAKRDYNTRITFRNGRIDTAVNTPLYYATPSSKAQNYNIVFDNITFGIADGATPAYWISRTNPTGSGVAFNNKITVTNCTFDLTGVTSDITLFGVGNSNSVVDDTLEIYGCDLYGDLTGVSLVSYTLSGNARFGFYKNANGNYITNTRLTSSACPSTVIETADGAMIFSKALSQNGDYTTYSLATDPLVTPYGLIPEEYASVSEYPVILFNADTGEVLLATKLLSDNTSASAMGLTDDKTANYVIYLRADVSTTGIAYNHGNAGGNIILDLNNHKVTLGSSLFWAQAKNSTTQNVTVKNGEIVIGGNHLVSTGAQSGSNKKMNYYFENVTFSGIAGGTLVRDSVSDKVAMTTTVNFNGCTFKVKETHTSALVQLGSASLATVSATFRGGSFVCEGETIPSFYTTGGQANKSVTFDKYNGNYTYVQTALSTVYADDTAILTPDGTYYFVEDSFDETTTTYKLGVKTAYGYIPNAYLDVDRYPLVGFDISTGRVVLGTDELTGEGNTTNGDYKALYYFSSVATAGKNYALLLRQDFKQKNTANWLMGATKCNLTFDLGGHTLTLTNRLYVMASRSASTCSITTKNGTINVGSQTVLDIGGKYNNKSFTMTFEDIVFDNVKAALVLDAQGSAYTIDADIIFQNCTVNTVGSLASYIVSIGHATNKVAVDVSFLGGKLVLAKAEYNIYSTKDVENKSVTFGMYNGEYPTVTLPDTVDVSTLVEYNTTGAPLGLYKTESVESAHTYLFSEARIVSAYLNLDSDINLIYRVYLPYGVENPKMTFTLGNFTEEVLPVGTDENGLYLFRLTAIGPHKMGDTVYASLVAAFGEETVSAENDTLSVKSYLDTVKNEHATDTVLVDLVEKLLVYGAAAQVYMNYNTDNLIAEVGELEVIPEEENTLLFEGNAVSDAKISACGLYLDGAFALRVTIEANDFSTLVLKTNKNGVTREYNLSAYAVGNKVTIYFDEISASELDTEVTFTLLRDGVQVGKTLTYSANAYLYRINETEDTALDNLARAIYAYGKSALAYQMAQNQ